MVAKFDHCLCSIGFGTDRLRRQKAMKTAGRENPNATSLQPSKWCGRSEQILLKPVGCEARKIPAEGDVFFLDFYLYRTNQDLRQIVCLHRAARMRLR
jgi:hypothetical protein